MKKLFIAVLAFLCAAGAVWALDPCAPGSSGTISSLTFGGFTADRPVYSDSSGELASGDDGGDLDVSGDDLEIKANAVGNNEMADDAITMDEIDDDGNFTSLTGNWATSGTLIGCIPVTDDGTDNNISKTVSDGEINGFIHDNDGDTWNLPDIDASDGLGWSICFYGDGANAITVNPDDEDIIIDTFDDRG